MAIAAVGAFVAAPAASAAPVLTENGTAIAVGSSILAKNTGSTQFVGAFNIECTSAQLKGTITTNSGTKIKGEIPVGSGTYGGTGTSGDCTSSLGSVKVTVNSKLCLETVTGTDNVAITGCGGNVVFTSTITGANSCKYSSASITANFTTNADSTIRVFEQPMKLIEGGFLCPTEGKLISDYDLTTTGGNTLSVS